MTKLEAQMFLKKVQKEIEFQDPGVSGSLNHLFEASIEELNAHSEIEGGYDIEVILAHIFCGTK